MTPGQKIPLNMTKIKNISKECFPAENICRESKLIYSVSKFPPENICHEKQQKLRIWKVFS